MPLPECGIWGRTGASILETLALGLAALLSLICYVLVAHMNERRLGKNDSKKKRDMIYAAYEIMLSEGVSSISASQVAKKINLKGATVHYYFQSIDDLIVAAFEISSDNLRSSLREAALQGNVMSTMWNLSRNGGAHILEMLALGMRRPRIGEAVRKVAEEFRETAIGLIEQDLGRRGIKADVPPVLTAIVFGGIAQTLSIDRALGMTLGHAVVDAHIKGWFDRYEACGESPVKSGISLAKEECESREIDQASFRSAPKSAT